MKKLILTIGLAVMVCIVGFGQDAKTIHYIALVNECEIDFYFSDPNNEKLDLIESRGAGKEGKITHFNLSKIYSITEQLQNFKGTAVYKEPVGNRTIYVMNYWDIVQKQVKVRAGWMEDAGKKSYFLLVRKELIEDKN